MRLERAELSADAEKSQACGDGMRLHISNGSSIEPELPRAPEALTEVRLTAPDAISMNPGCEEEKTKREIDVAQSIGSEHARVVAFEDGKAIIMSHNAVFGIRSWPVRKWKIFPPRPLAQYPVAIRVEFVEPRKRRRMCTDVDPDNLRYLTIELDDGAVLYDSRAEVPCDMAKWGETCRKHGQRRGDAITA